MEKLKMQTPDGVEMNLDKIAQLFPECITETRDEQGGVKRAVDFDLLWRRGRRPRYCLCAII